MNPRVFVSHASEDKERFVLNFSAKLRAQGIDAWVDRWEILPGDSLVDKLFEEGLKNAQAVIVVLSRFSVDKKWVREELNAAMVKRVNEASKLIPVVIDDCEVPYALQSTVWEKIADLDTFDSELARIVAAIYGHSEKPPLGSPPPYAQAAVPAITGLTREDAVALKIMGDTAVDHRHFIFSPDDAQKQAAAVGISAQMFDESFDILERRGYVTCVRTLSGRPVNPRLTSLGVDWYASHYVPRYSGLEREVGLLIVNKGMGKNFEIAAATGAPLNLVGHVLEKYKSRGFLDGAWTADGGFSIWNVRPELRRSLDQ